MQIPEDAALPRGVAQALSRAGMRVIVDPAIRAGHAVDWTGRWSGPVLAVVRPESTEQVASALHACRAHGVPVHVQGGNTSLVGGSVPEVPSVLVSTKGLRRVDPVDVLERTVVAGAGVTAAALQAHARASGLRFGVDLAARDTATVGGMVATNAGGLGVVAHGMMRDNVRGLTAVLADGRVVSTVGRPRKDNAGYQLADLLVGSEGTLGVVTEVEVVLHPPPAASTLAALAAPDLAGAVGLARSLQAAGWPLLAAEVVDAPGVARAARHLGVADPLPAGRPWLLLVEVADGGRGEALAEIADAVCAMATGDRDRRRLWALREQQTELHARLGGEIGLEKLDVSFRLDRLDEGVAAIRDLVAGAGTRGAGVQAGQGSGDAGGRRGGGAVHAPARGTDRSGHLEPTGEPRVGIFGHALDGNLHVQLLGAAPGTAQLVLAAVAELGGSISAEHGIGRLKADHLHLVRSAEEVAWMRQLRATVDPQGLLNGGVLLHG